MATLITAVATLALVAAGDGSQPSPLDTQAEPGQTLSERASARLTEQPEMAENEPPAPAYTVWDRLAACESTSNWAANTGNGYYGGLQQDLTFWRNHGGMQYARRPDLASRGQQIAIAEVGLRAQGWSAWPACSRRLGLR